MMTYQLLAWNLYQVRHTGWPINKWCTDPEPLYTILSQGRGLACQQQKSRNHIVFPPLTILDAHPCNTIGDGQNKTAYEGTHSPSFFNPFYSTNAHTKTGPHLIGAVFLLNVKSF